MRTWLERAMLALSWLLGTIAMLTFDYFGWIKLRPAVEPHTFETAVVAAAAIAFVFALIMRVLVGVAKFNCGGYTLAITLVPVTSYVMLRVFAANMPGFLILPSGFWGTAGVSLLLCMAYLPSETLKYGAKRQRPNTDPNVIDGELV